MRRTLNKRESHCCARSAAGRLKGARDCPTMRNTYFQGYRATGRYSDFASFGSIRRATAGADLALLHAALGGSDENERPDSKRIQRGNAPSALRFLVERRILTSIPLSRAAPCRPTGAVPRATHQCQWPHSTTCDTAPGEGGLRVVYLPIPNSHISE